ncbi:MAG TPA: hypothetical protein VFQ20_11915 [Burkholderiaceae bacterium]|nr:hypothetical protein [Burkholderiaceae bacterium]
MRVVVCAAVLTVASAAACAQASAPGAAADFPPEARTLTADALRERLAGKVFHVALANGASWRLQYQSGGYFYLNVSTGYADSGKWRVEDSKLCSEPQKTRAACNDVRLVSDLIYLRRDSGEIVRLEPR